MIGPSLRLPSSQEGPSNAEFNGVDIFYFNYNSVGSMLEMLEHLQDPIHHFGKSDGASLSLAGPSRFGMTRLMRFSRWLGST
jgi:hypothetical protein